MINSFQWKNFKVGDLFKISTSQSVDKLHLNFDDEGLYDFVGRTGTNNGIQGHLNALDFSANPKNTFSVTQIGDRVCQFRENDWYASQNIFVLTPLYEELLRTALFITTIITCMLKQVYGDTAYSSYPTLKTLPNDIIKLPATPDGKPDWDYMENYMRQVMDECELKYQLLAQTGIPQHPVDITAWKDFKVGDLFTIYHGTRLKSTDRIPGDIPLLTAGYENQGVTEYIGNEDMPVYNNSITIDMFGNCFYHDGIYTGDDNIYFFINDDISETSKIFISAVISNTLQNKYNFGKQFRQPDADSLVIRLPITLDNKPNWDYMEQYMQNVIDKQIYDLQCLIK